MEQILSWEPNNHSASQKFLAFYAVWRWTRYHQGPHSWATWVRATSSHTLSKRSILISLSHLSLYLPSGLFHTYFSTKVLYALLISPIQATNPAHFFVILRSSSLCILLQPFASSIVISPNILLSTVFSNNLDLYYSLSVKVIMNEKFTLWVLPFLRRHCFYFTKFTTYWKMSEVRFVHNKNI
jgi:hypothetical protein